MINEKIYKKDVLAARFKEVGNDGGLLDFTDLKIEKPIFSLPTIHYGNKTVETALILAAGDGTRLMPLTSDKPKVMVEIWKVSILERLLYNLKQAGITKVVIIVGYKSYVIKNYFGTRWKNIEIIYRDAKNYDDGILTSAVLGRGIINERFLFLLGDTIFETETIKRSMEMDGELVVGVRDECIDESVGAFVDENNRVGQIGMLKEMVSWNRVVTGLAVCEPIFLDAINECVEKGDYDRPSAMQVMVEKGLNVNAFDMTVDPWWESDDHKDLKKCKTEIFNKAWESRFIKTDLNFFKRFVNLPVSLTLTRLLAMTNVKPNHLTLASLCLSLIACVSFVFGHFVVGGISCYLCTVVDATDGKISRLKLCQSDFGSFLDSLVDRISEIAIVVGLSCGIYFKTGNIYTLLIGFIACIGWLGRFYLKELFIDKQGIKSWKDIKVPTFDFTGHRDFSFFIIMICCFVGYPLAPLLWMAVFGNALSCLKLYNFFKHFNAISSGKQL